jgi:copper transport protein
MTARAARRRTRWFQIAGVLAVLGGLLGVGVVLAPAASAHAVLISSSPVDGSRVNTEPTQVRLTFDEGIGLIPAAEEVISTDGVRADTGHAYLAGGGTTIVLPLKPHLQDGTYSATWRVVSADTHIVSGSITFGLGVAPGAGAATAADHTGQLDVAADVAQWLVYAGILLLVGVLAAVRVLWPWTGGRRRIRMMAWAGWALLLAGTVAAFLLQGPRAADASWGGVVSFQDAGLTAGSSFGMQLLGRIVLLCLVPLTFARRAADAVTSRGADVVRCVIGLALLASVAVTGHAGSGSDVWLALPSTTAHLAAMALWLGGLILLGSTVLPALRHGDRTLDDVALPRWSKIAYGCVVCLVVSGEYQAYRQVSPVQALWSTEYGITLLIKSGLIVLMLMAAALAHRRITSRPAGTPAAVARAVRRSVRIEAAAAVLVLAVTAVLVSEAPARTTYGPPVTLSAPLGNDLASIHIDSTLRGPQAITVRILDPEGALVRAQSVSATLSSSQVASLAVTMREAKSGGPQWTSAAAVAPLPGTWTLTLNVALDAADAYTTSASYQVW